MPNEGPDGDLEASTHNLGGDPHDSQTFSSGQLPYLSKRHGAEKMTPNVKIRFMMKILIKISSLMMEMKDKNILLQILGKAREIPNI